MQSRQGQLIDTGRHVLAFLDENAAVVGPNVAASRANLDDAITQLNTMAVTQNGGKIHSKGSTARQRSLRANLRANFMKPIAEIAKLKLGAVPEVGALTMPHKQLGATQLVAAAHAMADAAEIHAAVFAEVGLPADFITQLRSAADDVTASLSTRQVHVGLSTSATAGLKDQEKRVRNLFKLINALIVPKLGHNVVLLQKWKATKAIAHKAVVPVPAPATTTTPAATPAPTTTPSSTPGSTPAASTASTATTAPAAAPAPVATPATPATPAPVAATSPSPAGGSTPPAATPTA